jgi:hypothetical protein
MDAEYINSLTALITAIGVLGVLVQGWFTRKAITDVAIHTNSIKDELVQEVRLASYAKGRLAGPETKETQESTSDAKG